MSISLAAPLSILRVQSFHICMTQVQWGAAESAHSSQEAADVPAHALLPVWDGGSLTWRSYGQR